MNTDAVKLLIETNAESNQVAMTDMAQVFATSLKEKPADNQARFEAMMEKMQNRMDHATGCQYEGCARPFGQG